MNEFTKEELERIQEGVTWWVGDVALYSEELINKIQSMIDNYPTSDSQPIVNKECEHEPENILYTTMPCSYKCKKCGEFYR